jgi:hypothetical protein
MIMVLYGEIIKNKKQKILVFTDNYMGHEVCHVRTSIEIEPDKWILTRRGVAFSIDLLPEIIEALKIAYNKGQVSR